MVLAAAGIWLGVSTSANANLVITSVQRVNPETGTMLQARATFDVVGSQLTILLENIGGDVRAPSDVLTALFWDPTANLTPVSAVLGSGSTVLFGTTDPGGVVGGEWEYAAGLNNAPARAVLGVSSSGFGLSGTLLRMFPGNNLQGPDSPDGVQYGITSAVDIPTTGNAAVTGGNALIQNSVLFTLDISGNYNLADIHNVSFQYGTTLGSEPNLPGVPEPSTLLAGALLLLPFGASMLKVLRRRRTA